MARILIIDDEPQVRTMLRKILEYEGYEVVDAKDGKDGLNLFRNRPIDLVITDLIMPEKDGLQTIKELRQIVPGIRIIAISGGGRFDPRDFLKVAKTFGAHRAFSKPVENNRLLRAIAELFK